MSESIAEKVKIVSDRKRISYSQFSKWVACPMAWKYAYIDGLSKFENNIHCCFGTAIHEAVQTFVNELYTGGSAAADSIDVVKIFRDVLDKELEGVGKEKRLDDEGNPVLDENGKSIYDEVKNPVVVSDDDLNTFIEHGMLILNYFTSFANRSKYFPSKKYEIVGIELPLSMPIMNNLSFIGYLDIVLRDTQTGKIKIIDLKTSGRMWNKYQQNDMTKIMQLVLYKAFYSKQFGLPLNKIDVEFIILKRTLLEGVSFPESRLQRVVPMSGSTVVDDSVKLLVEFIENCFTSEGIHNSTGKFKKNPHKGKTRYSNCKYCDFSVKNGGPCDRKEGVVDFSENPS